MKRSTRGMGRVYQRGDMWWIQYSYKGVRKRESSDSTKRPEAVALLKRRQQEAGSGRPHEDAAKILLSDLDKIIRDDYDLQQRRSGKRLAQLWHHLAEHFGRDEPAIRITGPRLGSYVVARLEE